MQGRIPRPPIVILCLVALAACAVGCGGATPVETTHPARQAIQESFSEQARTRLRRTWPVTMPVDGRIGRIELEPGDPVRAGQTLATFDTEPLARQLAEARASVDELTASLRLNAYDAIEQTLLVETSTTIHAAGEALKAAAAQVDAERARADRASAELRRIEDLFKSGATPQQKLDDARLAAETALIDLRTKQFDLAAYRAVYTIIQLGPQYVRQWLARKRLARDELSERLRAAEARLGAVRHELELARIVSPIDGVVLRRDEQGGGFLAAGRPLLLLGDMHDLEAVADVLTEDALRLTSGSQVTLDAAGGLPAIAGSVRRIEPAGFTKLSSLGVEQQRVNVMIALGATPPALGAGYRLQARFLTAARADALVVPRPSVLQAPDGSHYVFKIVGGRLHRQAVELGLANDTQIEITKGLAASDTIAATPDTSLVDGQKVSAEESE